MFLDWRLGKQIGFFFSAFVVRNLSIQSSQSYPRDFCLLVDKDHTFLSDLSSYYKSVFTVLHLVNPF